jgi:ribosomal protein S18 acetylase RimI-like enzyme
MLVYDDKVIQLRGGKQAADPLLENLNLKKVEITGSQEQSASILGKFRSSEIHTLVLMTLERQAAKLQTGQPIVRLDSSDSEEIAVLLRETNPEFWGELTGEGITYRMETTYWFGIKIKGKLVSVGSQRMTEWGGHIGVIATHESHRNKGYASSIVSYIVEQILKESPFAIINVLSDNAPAIRIYERAGFKPYKEYLYMKGERIE